VVAAAIVVVAVTACGWLMLTAGQMGDGWADASDPGRSAPCCWTRISAASGCGGSASPLCCWAAGAGQHDRWPIRHGWPP
jgi:hypothetical protein